MFLDDGKVYSKVNEKTVLKASKIEVKAEPVDLGNLSSNKNIDNYINKFR